MKIIKSIKFFKGGGYSIRLNKELKTIAEENQFIEELTIRLNKERLKKFIK